MLTSLTHGNGQTAGTFPTVRRRACAGSVGAR
jgi:hypothetical protein